MLARLLRHTLSKNKLGGDMSANKTIILQQTEKKLDPIRRTIKDIARALNLYRVHIGVMLFISFLYANKQTADVVRALVERQDWVEFPRLVLAGIFILGLVPFMTWYSGRWLSMQEPLLGLRNDGVLGWWLRWTPRFCSVIPLGFLAWFLIKHRADDAIFFPIGSAICIIVGALWLVFFKRRNNDDQTFLERAVKAFNWYWRSASISLVVIMVLIWVEPVWFPQLIGTIPSVLLFFIVFTLCATFLSWRYEKAGIPWLTIGFLWTVGWSFTNMTDNHELRFVKPKTELPKQKLLENSFQDWLDARIDIWKKRGAGNEYPVFIIAAEGGGIYAAQNAAFTLGRLEDMSNKLGAAKPFSHNTFAISGISGGSIGAALFVSHLVDMGKKNPSDETEDVLARILNQDLLSPIAANMFSLDYLQRFVFFYPYIPDRAAALEDAVASAWELEHKDRTTLDQAFSQLAAGSTGFPSLVLNTAEINSGRTVASAPFRFTTVASEERQFRNVFEGDGERQTFREILKPRESTQQLYQHLDKCELSGPSLEKLKPYKRTEDFDKVREMSVLRSAVTSARFPYVSPAGFLMRRDIQKCGPDEKFDVVYRSQYVDGGYVEASGTEPALAILKRLNDRIVWLSEQRGSKYEHLYKKVKLHLVTIELGSPQKLKNANNGEISTPPMGLLATWGARSKIAREQAIDYVNSFTKEGQYKSDTQEQVSSSPESRTSAIGGIHRIQPFDSEETIPLGWRLSNQSSWKLRQLLCKEKTAPLQEKFVKAPFPAMRNLAFLAAVDPSKPNALVGFCDKYKRDE